VDAAVTTIFVQMRLVMLLWGAVVAVAFGAFIVHSLRKQRRSRRSHGPAPALLSALAGAGDTIMIDPAITQIVQPVEQPAIADEPTVIVDAMGSKGRELDRFADEMAVAAERSTVTAERRHDQWQAAQRTREAAWDAFNAADLEVRRLERAAAFPITFPDTASDDVEEEPDAVALARQERYLKRMVGRAYERGEISGKQLREALAHRGGWDPRRHPFELQLVLRRLVRERRLRAYQEAAAVEQAAWHTADLAAAARSALHAEALAAEHRNTAHRLTQTVERAKTKSAGRNTWSRSRAGELVGR